MINLNKLIIVEKMLNENKIVKVELRLGDITPYDPSHWKYKVIIIYENNAVDIRYETIVDIRQKYLKFLSDDDQRLIYF